MRKITVKITNNKNRKQKTINELENPLETLRKVGKGTYGAIKNKIDTIKIEREKRKREYINTIESSILTDLSNNNSVQLVKERVARNSSILSKGGTHSVRVSFDSQLFKDKTLPRVIGEKKTWEISASVLITLYDYDVVRRTNNIKNILFKTTDNVYYSIHVSYELTINDQQIRNTIGIANSDSGVIKTNYRNLEFPSYNIFKDIASKYATVVKEIQNKIKENTTSGITNV